MVWLLLRVAGLPFVPCTRTDKNALVSPVKLYTERIAGDQFGLEGAPVVGDWDDFCGVVQVGC